MTQLTAQVSDAARGQPAPDMAIDLYMVAPDGSAELITSTRTNAEGRNDRPLLLGNDYTHGIYELVFHVAEYFATKPVNAPNPPFLTHIPIRFSILERSRKTDVQLVVSPWSYTVHRG